MSLSHRHRRSLSGHSRDSSQIPRSPSPPSQVYHPSLLPLPQAVPTPALVESVAGGAHYSGVKVDSEAVLKRRRSTSHQNPGELSKHDHQRIIDDLTELYCCRPTLEIFKRSWDVEAEFEDPLCRCKGFHEYAAQFFAMSKFFSHSEQISKRVMSSTAAPNRLIYHNVQEYTTRWFKKKKRIESIIVVDLDDNDKITRLVDQWDGEDLPTRWGASLLRTINAKLTPWFVSVPKHNSVAAS